ncbi:MAG: hypothetical protein H7Z75_01385 [Ferruginibacter sp.]|nr:hypothetical protein [Cytophagales bacterium]
MPVLPATENLPWLSVYLCFAEPWETFLVQAVKPFVEHAMNEQWARQFFFIRYWERGPHLRLRFKGNAQTLEGTLKPALLRHFGDYFIQHPSRRHDPDWTSALPAEYQWFPNNSCQFVPYQPELERYGGPAGILLAEQQFDTSSRAVLGLLSENAHWDYNRAMGAAVQLHLGFAHALKMDRTETAGFFDRVFQGWSSQVYQPIAEVLPEAERSRRHQAVMRVFENSFQQQKPVLMPLFSTVWEALEAGQEFEQEWFNGWLRGLRLIDQQLHQAQATGALDALAWGLPTEADPGAANQQIRWLLFDSYLHMTNNRLGIQNREEGYLGFLLKEGFREMTLVS